MFAVLHTQMAFMANEMIDFGPDKIASYGKQNAKKWKQQTETYVAWKNTIAHVI